MKSRKYSFSHSIAFILFLCLTLCGIFGLWTGIEKRQAYQIPALTDADLSALDLSQAKHLMIVAHPDDETIWGGAHLQEGGYLVVCITNGKRQTRADEFHEVMEQSGNVGLILSYPDKVGGKRDDWKQVRTQIQADLEKIMLYKPWDDIVTHNAKGEYGHIHHKMTHQFVTQLYDKNALDMPLYTFGKYYRADALPAVESELTPVSAEALQKKEALLKCYTSQKSTVRSLSHMNPYEMWTTIRGGAQNDKTAS